MRRVVVIGVAVLAFASNATAGDKGLMGALIGAGAGAAIGHSVDRTGGAGKGAAIGAIGGYIIGSQLDKNGQQQSAAPATTQASGGESLAAGDCRQGQSYFEQAEKSSNIEDKVFYLQQAARLCPSDARVHNDLGVAYYHRGGRHDRERAKIELREALRIDPNYSVARNNLNRL